MSICGFMYTFQNVFVLRTCACVIAGLVHLALKELQTHDGVDGDHEEDEQCDVEQRQH